MRDEHDELAYESEYTPDPSTYAVPAEEVVFAGSVDLMDRDNPPGAQICKCGRAYDWRWWPGRRLSSGLQVRGRWTPPAINPCERCALKAAIDEGTREMDRRQERAGIARVHRGFQWALAVMQGQGETWNDFAHTVKARAGAIGVALEDVGAYEAVSCWEPAHGSLFIHGPPGSGKSLWVSARLSELVSPTEETEVRLTAEQLVSRGMNPTAAARCVAEGLNKAIKPGGLQLHQPLLIDEEEILRRVGLSWKGDPVPLLGIARTGILAYDDMGTVLLAASEKGKEHARQCIARLVDLRWREHLPFLITSNRSLPEICDALDRKTADRLRETVRKEVVMHGVPGHVIQRGYSWRNLPPVGGLL